MKGRLAVAVVSAVVFSLSGCGSSQSGVASSPTPSGMPSLSSTTGPNAVFPGAVVTTAGLGPLTVGMSVSALQEGGYVVANPSQCVSPWVSNASLEGDGVSLVVTDNALTSIYLAKATYATDLGARVGMTVADLRKIYGADLVTDVKSGGGGPFAVPIVRAGDRELVFRTPWTDGSFTDESKVETIVVEPYTRQYLDGC